jgi:hypothetical protein
MASLPSPAGPLILSDAKYSAVFSDKILLYKGNITLIDVSVVGIMNTAAGIITVSSVDTASGSSDSITVQNTFCSENSVIVATIASYGGIIGTDGFPSLIVTPGNNLFTITIVNESIAAAALDGSLIIHFMIV